MPEKRCQRPKIPLPSTISLKLQIVLYYVFLIIVPFLLLILFSLNILYRHTCNIYGDYLVTNLTSAGEQLGIAYNRYRDTSTSLYLNKTVEYLEKTALTEQDWERITQELNSICNSNASMASIQVEAHGRMVHAGTSNASIVEYVDSNRQRILAEGGRMVWLPQSFYSPYPFGTSKYVIARALNTADKQNIGILYMTVDKGIFDDAFGAINMSDATTYLVNDGGDILYSSDTQALNQPFGILDAAALGKTGYHTERVGGADCLVAYVRSYKTGWLQLVVVPVGSLLSNFAPVRLGIALIGCAYVLLVAVMIALMNRHVIRPVVYLTHVMDLFADDSLHTNPDETYRTREINSLFVHFNSMTRKVQELIADNRRVEREKNNYEMQVLISQMNPHFIYNSLNTVKWLAVINKQATIRNVTDSLIYILMQITNKESSTHRLADEIRLLEHYAVIQKTRFMNFEASFLPGGGTEDLLIRKFLLHSIVENAIVHGFSRGKVSGGQINLVSYRQDNQLHVVIADNGKGFDTAHWAGQEAPEDRRHTNIGIRNIQQIIRLEYGEAYGLSVESAPGKGTRAHFVLPIIESEGAQA